MIYVPVDITGEEKVVMGKLSKRQFFLVFPASVVAAIFLVYGGIPFVEGTPENVIKIILVLINEAVFICLAWIKLPKQEQFLNEFLMTQIRFRRSQKTYY